MLWTDQEWNPSQRGCVPNGDTMGGWSERLVLHRDRKLCHLGINVRHFVSVAFDNTEEPHWKAKELEWLEEKDFSLFTSPRTLRKKIRHWKKGSNYLDGTNILSFWGKNLEGSDLSLMEVKTWQTPSPFHLCTQELFLMTAQNCMHLENRLSEASATVQHIHMNAQCGLVIWTGFSQEFSYTWSNQGGTRGSCVKHRNNKFTILLHHLISYCLYWS